MNAKATKQNEDRESNMKNGMMTRDKKRRILRKPEPVDMASILRAPALQPGVVAGKTSAPKLTPYAEQLLARSSASQAGNLSLVPSDEWITTRVAAKVTGYSQRQIQALCEAGFLVEGKEWKQRLPSPGSRRRGRILIRPSALKKMEGEA